MWTALITGVTTVIGKLFGMKEKQGEVVEGVLGTLSSINDADAAQAEATAKAIQAVYEQGGFIERAWRPVFMWIAMGLIVARWFGYSPPHLSPEEVQHIYTFLYIGVGGYLPLQSIDKWMRGFQIGSILKEYISKKVL